MTLLAFLFSLDRLGVLDAYRDGPLLVFGLDWQRHDARKFRRLLRQAKKCGVDRELWRRVSPLPLEQRNQIREGCLV